MNRDIHSQAEQLNKKHRRKRTWYKILSVPICLVVFVTTYALILPAITLESTPDTYCGIAEHVHTDDCYEFPGTPAHKEIQCTAGADLHGFNLTATGTNDAVLLQSTTVAGFTFTNTYTDTGRDLTLKKIVNAPDTKGSFTFTVSYKDAGGNPQTASVTLKNGESTTITGIPRGVQVTVTETTTDGYTVIMKDPSTGTVLAGSSSYTFTMNDDTAVDIYNTSIVTLPETGGIGQGIFLFAGIGLMLTSVITGCLLRRKYGKEAD